MFVKAEAALCERTGLSKVIAIRRAPYWSAISHPWADYRYIRQVRLARRGFGRRMAHLGECVSSTSDPVGSE